jgi:hypothetical protein
MTERPPRYRFPNEVRDATRAMAVQMVRDGRVPDTPAQFDAWIDTAPAREVLERGGYGRDFTAEDLLPLLRVFVEQEGGPAHAGEPATATAAAGLPRWAMIALAVVAVLGLLLLVLQVVPR